MRVCHYTIAEAHAALQAGYITSIALTRQILDRIEQVEPRIRAYLHLAPDLALRAAEDADRRRADGEEHPLLGVPLAIKDVLCTRDMPTTCGSRMLEGFAPPYDATVVARLREAGIVPLGKTNTDEFAMGSSTENSGYWTTHNPWDLDRVPGGSSGGSAAAVAAGACVAALGTDTGGSIRQPAAFCGVVGLKPTYGRVSRHGLVAFASSLDQAGPITRTVSDAALLLTAMAGHDPLDATSAAEPVPSYADLLHGGVRGMRLGLAREYLCEDGVDPTVTAAIHDAVGVWRDLGAEVVEVSLPHTEYALPVYYLLAPAEASANLARYDGVRYGFSHPEAQDIWDAYRKSRQVGLGAEVKRRIMIGAYALSSGYYDAYYLKAQKVRTLIKRDFTEAFRQCDAIIAPTTPTPAFAIGEKANDPLQMYMADVFTLSLNLAGLCGISIPCGLVDGLPVGVQILGDAFQEGTILRVAHAFEQATPWHLMQPKLCAAEGEL